MQSVCAYAMDFVSVHKQIIYIKIKLLQYFGVMNMEFKKAR